LRPHRNKLGRLKLVLVIVEIQCVGLRLWERPWRAIGHGPAIVSDGCFKLRAQSALLNAGLIIVSPSGTKAGPDI
jgi:hypothetical protein